jgi:hypothetical protein
MARIHTQFIDETECIGDSLDSINNSFQNLDTSVQNLSSFDNNLNTGLTVINNTPKIINGTTSQRPVSPEAGMVRYNTTTSRLEYYNGSTWIPTGGIKFDYTSNKYWIVTDVAYNGITPTNTYNLGQLPNDTVAIVLFVFYSHGHAGTTTHGYWSFDAYQEGFSSNFVEYRASHYNDYYNTTWELLLVPWNSSTNSNLVIKTISSFNTNIANNYSIRFNGLIRGANLYS